MELDLELYRRDVVVSDQPRVRLSAIATGPGEALAETLRDGRAAGRQFAKPAPASFPGKRGAPPSS